MTTLLYAGAAELINGTERMTGGAVHQWNNGSTTGPTETPDRSGMAERLVQLIVGAATS